MGPRSDNRGYGGYGEEGANRRTKASMGPRSDNRGYDADRGTLAVDMGMLQWVHGRITVVMCADRLGCAATQPASMGPRSDNRGYARLPYPTIDARDGL